MSLAQHVSSTEGADREWIEPLIDEEFPLGRVLSYDPLPPVQVEDIAEHVAAYKVRKRIRYGKRFPPMSQGQSNLQLLFSFRMFPRLVVQLKIIRPYFRSSHRRLAKQ
jgi:hypothetical protein